MSTSISDSNMTPEKTQSPIRYPSDLIDYYNKWTDNRTLEKVNTALRQHFREKKSKPRPDDSHR